MRENDHTFNRVVDLCFLLLGDIEGMLDGTFAEKIPKLMYYYAEDVQTIADLDPEPDDTLLYLKKYFLSIGEYWDEDS